jgi:predicted amidohydrolase
MAQLLVEGGEPKRNLERAAQMVEDASSKGCDIVLLPECLDFAWTHPSAKIESHPIPGLFSKRIGEMAREHNVFVCAGLTEKDGRLVYNSAVFFDNSGRMLLKYRKINILEEALEFYEIGDSLGVVQTPFGIIGVNICSDNYADASEIGNALGRMGAQLILSPSSWTVGYSQTKDMDPYGEKWLDPYSKLAEKFHLIIAGSTSVGCLVGGPFEGRKSIGCSLAVGPDGVIAKGEYNEFTSELVVAEFEIPNRERRGTRLGSME